MTLEEETMAETECKTINMGHMTVVWIELMVVEASGMVIEIIDQEVEEEVVISAEQEEIEVEAEVVLEEMAQDIWALIEIDQAIEEMDLEKEVMLTPSTMISSL